MKCYEIPCVASEGFEPPTREPESLVLPLHQEAETDLLITSKSET